jgi:crooked neck
MSYALLEAEAIPLPRAEREEDEEDEDEGKEKEGKRVPGEPTLLGRCSRGVTRI